MKKNNSTKNELTEQLNLQQTEGTTLAKIKEIYSLMCKNNITEISVPICEIKVKIKRFVADEKTTSTVTTPQVIVENKVDEQEAEQIQVGTEEITSPLNGVFYRSPSPGAPPFVKEGDVVQPGSVLCIIEAMKIMNEIKSEKKCRILKVLCDNGSSVSVGTKLFLVEPL